jgi:hypothetical protein
LHALFGGDATKHQRFGALPDEKEKAAFWRPFRMTL